jgi:RNA polymerase sigma-70 factor (ECF subfamily)
VPATAPKPEPASKVPTISELFAENVRFVWRVLAAHGVSAADVEDMTQEVFLVAHKHLTQESEVERRKPRSWLYAIAVRVAANHRRRAHVRREQPRDEVPAPDGESIDPVESIDRERMRERLYDALGAIEEDKRHVLVLFELEGMPMKEVAETIGCPLSTAYTRLYAAREELGRALRISLIGLGGKR